MRDLIERHDAFGAEMMADLTRKPGLEAPAEPAGGHIEVGRSSTHAGSGTAALGFGRASEDRGRLVPAGTPEPRADEETKP